MRTFHTGGVAGEDITQGLPRAEELFEARKTIKSGEAGISPLAGYITSVTPTATGEDQVEISGETRMVRIPAAIARAEKGEEVDVEAIIDPKSPCAGEIYLIGDSGEGQELLVIDTGSGDRAYKLPPGAKPKVKNGRKVAEGDALTERFNVPGIVAEHAGTIRLPEDKDRFVELVGSDGSVAEYEIPYGARLLVEPGAKVVEGDQLTSRSKPIFIAAEGDGKAVVLEDRIIVYNTSGGGTRLKLTHDLRPLKRHGSPVKANEAIVALEILHRGTVFIERVDEEKDIVTVYLQPKSTVKVEKAVTVRVGDKVEEGDLLTKGVVAPHTLLEAAGVHKAREYLLNEIHKVYKQQGVDINDKHLEVIIRQILNNVRIIDRGDSRFLLGDLVTLEEFRKEIRELNQYNQDAERLQREALGLKLTEDVVVDGHLIVTAGDALSEDVITACRRSGIALVRVQSDDEEIEVRLAAKLLPDGERELLRISKAALQTKGWLSAASFQRTTKVLSEAALRGEVDELDGLKPSIIVGRRIPSGTGYDVGSRLVPEGGVGAGEDGTLEAEGVAATIDDAAVEG